MFTPPHRHQSSVSIPRRKRRSWSFLLVLMESLFVASLVLGIFYGGSVAYQRLISDVFFPVRHVNIEESPKYGSFQEVGDIIINHAQERDLLHIDAIAVANEIKNLPWVKKAKIVKRWPHTIEVQLEERVPVVRWGDSEFLDQTGYRFSVPDSEVLQQLFTLRGPDGYESQVLQHYQKIQPWLVQQKLPIEQFILDPRLVWHLTLKGGIQVILGREHLNDRLKKLVIINRKVIQPYKEYIDRIDLRYKDGFSVRWKKGVAPSSKTKEKIGKTMKRKS